MQNRFEQNNQSVKEVKEPFQIITLNSEILENEIKQAKSKRMTFVQKINLLLVFILTIISSVWYYRSLKGCHLTQVECLSKLDSGFFIKISICVVISSLINAMILVLAIHKKISRISIILIVIIFGPLFLYDRGSDLSHHGAYNQFGEMAFFVLMVLIIEGIYWCGWLIYTKKLLIASFILLIISLFLFYCKFSLNTKCDGWDIGLNHVSISDDPKLDSCKIHRPEKCYVQPLLGFFDISRYFLRKCSHKSTEKKTMGYVLRKELKTSLNLAFPITTNFDYLNESCYPSIYNNIYEAMYDLKDINNILHNKRGDKPEVTVHYDAITQEGTIKMEMVKNKTLSEIRNKKAEATKDNAFQNILFLYIDAISRPHFFRKMKKTIQILEKYYNSSLYNISSYQFLKYHNFDAFTQINVVPMLYGQPMRSGNGKSIIKYFKEKGFITAQSSNFCSREMFDIEKHYYSANLKWEAYDHENIAMFCDPNYIDPKNPYPPFMGPYSVLRRCLYGTDVFNYVFDYGELFWTTYKEDKKFLRLSFTDAHEGTGEVVGYLDDRLSSFILKYLDKLNDEKTAIIIVSDHGNNMIGVHDFLFSEDFFVEKTLGTLFMILPNSISEKENESLKYNEQRIITPYDIHDTLLYMINYKTTSAVYSSSGKPLFEKINGLERNCKKYSDMNNQKCQCKPFK